MQGLRVLLPCHSGPWGRGCTAGRSGQMARSVKSSLTLRETERRVISLAGDLATTRSKVCGRSLFLIRVAKSPARGITRICLVLGFTIANLDDSLVNSKDYALRKGFQSCWSAFSL